jgi:diamine N-acetyltransferase
MDLSKYEILEGEFVVLRKMTVADAEVIYNWRISDSGGLMTQPANYSLEYQKKWMLALPSNEINYLIICANTQKPLGTIAIVTISELHQNAEIGRFLLAPEYLKKSNPYGLEALKLCYSLIINDWKFKKIFGTVVSTNIPMLRMQKYLGMKEEGVLKQHKIINGEYIDLHLVAIFENELNKSYLPKISLLLKAFKKDTIKND